MKKSEVFLKECLECVVKSASFLESINKILNKLGHFFSAKTAYFEYYDINNVPYNISWHSQASSKTLESPIISFEEYKKIDNKSINIIKKYKKRDVNNLVLMPIYLKDRLSAYIGLDDPDLFKVKRSIGVLSSLMIILSFNVYKNYMIDFLKIDKLTGIDRVEKFIIETEKIIHSTSNNYLLCKIDINNMKFINEYYGYEMGNTILINIANTIKSHESVKACARMSNSDNFYFLTDCDPNRVEDVFVKFKEIIVSNSKGINVDYSCGVYPIKNKDLPVREMLSYVALAHKSAKADLINRLYFYDEHMIESMLDTHEVLTSFANAINNEEFKLYIQPKYNIDENKIFAGEVLVRWEKNHELVSPAHFIPILEQNGLIKELDYYVFEKTAQLIRKWLDNNMRAIPLSVNLSRYDVSDKNLTRFVLDLLEKYEIPHNLFKIEITESAYTKDDYNLMSFVNEMRKNNIDILMDDFGSGYSSLNMLKDVDISILKIDYLFMSKCKIESRKRNIIASVVNMAKMIDVDVIAEGVETSEDAKFLTEIGVKYAQGFLYSKPISVSMFERKINL